MRNRGRFTCVDVVAIVLVAGIGGTLVAAATVSKTEAANRAKCAHNLQQLGVAMMLYANENRGAVPRTTFQPDAEVTWGTPYPSANPPKEMVTQESDPFAVEKTASKAALATRPAPNDVTAAMFLILRTEDIVQEEFICPSTTLKRFDYGGEGHSALDWTNFPGKDGVAAHLSYSYQNPYLSTAVMKKYGKYDFAAEVALMSDMNPGVDALLAAKVEDAPKPDADLTAAQRALNSLNHRGDGQNVLYADGHVEFMNNPFVGAKRDNIFIANDAARDRKEPKPAFATSPADANDSILLPTAAAVGQKPEPTSENPSATTR